MPKRILIIGILFCLVGLISIWGIISNLIQSGSVLSELVIDINTIQALALPIGIGLLMRRQWSQWWARLAIVVGYVFCLMSVFVAVISPEKVYFTWFNQSITGDWKIRFFLASMLLIISMLVCINRLLYSEKAKNYFNQL